MTKPSDPLGDTFQAHMVELTRAFGWHRPDSTPCGKAVPIAEAHALLELSRAPSLTQQDLTVALNLSKSTVSHLVAKLERRGWVRKERNEEDGRARDVSLTDSGAAAAADLAAARRTRMAGVLARIPSGQRAVVTQALRTLVEAVHEDNE